MLLCALILKAQKPLMSTAIFALLGSLRVKKASRKMLVKSTPGDVAFVYNCDRTLILNESKKRVF